MSWKDFKYNDDCKKLIEHQTNNTKFHEYMSRFDDWADIIKPHVKLDSKSNMMEIGCGLGVLSLKLHLESDCKTYLIDKSIDLDNPPKLSWGNKDFAYSCNLDVTKSLFSENNAKMENIYFIENDEIDWDQIPDLDFVLSKDSWGMINHLTEYWDNVTAKLKPDGFIILSCHFRYPGKSTMGSFYYNSWLDNKGWAMTEINNTETKKLKIFKIQRKAS